MVGLLATVVRPAAARRLLRHDRDHVVAVDDFAGLGARQPPARAPQHACWLGLAPDVGKRRWPAARQRLEASMLAAESLPDWNDLGSLGVTRPDYRDSGEAGVLAQGPSDLHLATTGSPASPQPGGIKEFEQRSLDGPERAVLGSNQ
jgi:hypothetical protein